jgi:PleD family two-component response regulator
MVFSIDANVDRAKDTAERILARLSRHQMALAGMKSSVSIGIATHDGADTDFSRMYCDADTALYQARVEGKSCIGVFEPSATAALPANTPQALTV